MTTENKNQKIDQTVLAAFKKRVNTLFAERGVWETTLLATANQRLYQLLGEIYTVYLEARVGNDVEPRKYAWLLAEVQARKIPTAKTPTFIQLITKLVFSSSDTDSRRVNSYARVLSCAAQEGVGTGNAIADYITQRGGIEEIRAALAKNTKTPTQRSTEGRSIADAQRTIAVVANDELGKYAADASGRYVVLLGKMNAQGHIEVKHAVFEAAVGGDRIAGKTVVAGALSNLYSTYAQAAKKSAKRVNAEETAEVKNGVFNKIPQRDAKSAMKHAA